MKTDVLIIGAGISGLSAALAAQKAGASTTVVATGMGVLYLNSGCVDLLAYPTGEEDGPAQKPLEAVATLRQTNPDHPYSKLSDTELCTALDEFMRVCTRQGLPMFGDPNRNWLIPTALGTGKPTAIVQGTMVKGDMADKTPITLVGFSDFRNFFPEPAAAALAKSGIETTALTFDPAEQMGARAVNTISLGAAFENLAFCEEVARFINRNAPPDCRIGLPAVLGVDQTRMAHQTLEGLTGRGVFEMPILPPSLPGRRVFQALKRELFELGGQLVNGCPVVGVDRDGTKIDSVLYKAGGVTRKVRAKAVVLATGSFFSGGLILKRKVVREPVFGLPVRFQPPVDQRFGKEFLAPTGHPIGRAGIRVNGDLRPCDKDDVPLLRNLFACGDVLGGFDSLQQRCGGGVAIGTGAKAGAKAAQTAGR